MVRVETRDVLTRPSDLPDAVARYADHEHALIDVHLPPARTGALPVVLLIHGGFWLAEWDRLHARPLANALAAEGMVVASVEYRRVGNGGGWPTTLHDVRAAADALPGVLADLGVEATSTTVVGHSAGGHLALWLANEDLPWTRVVALAPVSALRRGAGDPEAGHYIRDFLGGSPEQFPERYDDADPGTRFEEPPACPVIVVHGSEDEEVPVRSSRGLTKHFPFVRLHEVAGADHFALIDPASSGWPVVLAAVTGERARD